jgi:AcrR family transcriptional regulator
MGRPGKFQESEAVNAAARVFRQRGYASTSVDHLVDATGVHRGSLYGVFGSKHGLFLRVLDALNADDADQTARLDVVLIGLLELSPTDPGVRHRITDMLTTHHITTAQLGTRLLDRAGVDIKEKKS